MDHTGCINWPRTGELTWTDTRQGSTYVWAYWLVDHKKHGLDLLEAQPRGQEWFFAHEDANIMGAPLIVEGEHPSPNFRQVENSSGLLAAVCLGTAAGTYRSTMRDGYFWAGHRDLTREGRNLVSVLSGLYGRPPVLVTFLRIRPMNQAVPEAAHDSATVDAVSGHTALT